MTHLFRQNENFKKQLNNERRIQERDIQHPHLVKQQESQLPPYRPPQNPSIVFCQDSTFRPVQPTFPRTSPHHYGTVIRQPVPPRRLTSESDDDWSYEVAQEHAV